MDKEELMRLWTFDLITRNADRHSNNGLVKDGKIIPIDHGLCFGKDLLRTYRDFFNEEIPADLIENLQKFSECDNNRKVLRQLLAELLPDDEVDQFFERLDRITKILVEQRKIPSGSYPVIFGGEIEL